MRSTKRRLITAIAVAPLLLAGCGGGGGSSSTQRGQASQPAQTSTAPSATTATGRSPQAAGAVTEIAAVQSMLRRALALYRGGERARAERLVGDAYLERFERVERPLEKRDPALTARLELRISTVIRQRMKQGRPVAEVARLVAQTERDLDRARRLLR